MTEEQPPGDHPWQYPAPPPPTYPDPTQPAYPDPTQAAYPNLPPPAPGGGYGPPQGYPPPQGQGQSPQGYPPPPQGYPPPPPGYPPPQYQPRPYGPEPWRHQQPSVPAARKRANRVVGQLTQVLLALSIPLQILAITRVMHQRSALDDAVRGTGSRSAVADADHEVRVVSVVIIVAVLVTAAAFITWLYRLRKDAEVFHPMLQERGAGWAIGGWFIPFANFVIPFLVTRDVARALALPVGTYDQKPKQPPILAVWWTLWVVGAISNRIILAQDPDTPSAFDTHVTWEIVSALITIAAALLAIAVVQRMTTDDAKQWDRVAAVTGAAS